MMRRPSPWLWPPDVHSCACSSVCLYCRHHKQICLPGRRITQRYTLRRGPRLQFNTLGSFELKFFIFFSLSLFYKWSPMGQWSVYCSPPSPTCPTKRFSAIFSSNPPAALGDLGTGSKYAPHTESGAGPGTGDVCTFFTSIPISDVK